MLHTNFLPCNIPLFRLSKPDVLSLAPGSSGDRAGGRYRVCRPLNVSPLLGFERFMRAYPSWTRRDPVGFFWFNHHGNQSSITSSGPMPTNPLDTQGCFAHFLPHLSHPSFATEVEIVRKAIQSQRDGKKSTEPHCHVPGREGESRSPVCR